MLDLLDYRRQISELYARIRQADDPYTAWQDFRTTRDTLFRIHAQSPLTAAQQAVFSGLAFYAYDPAYRVLARVEAAEPLELDYDLGDDGQFRCTRFGQVRFTLPTGDGALSLYWINGYGGGLFLPFGDTTNRTTTYGGGRYLADTIKGADAGMQAGELILDFNFAYHPSCAYDPRWVCPLAPSDNRLALAVLAGERL